VSRPSSHRAPMVITSTSRMSSTLYAAAVPNAVLRPARGSRPRSDGSHVCTAPRSPRTRRRRRRRPASFRHEAWTRGRDHDATERQPARCAEATRRVLERGVHLAQRSLHGARDERDVPDEVGQREDPERADEQHAQLRRRVPVEGRREAERDRRRVGGGRGGGGGNSPRERGEQRDRSAAGRARQHDDVRDGEAHDRVGRVAAADIPMLFVIGTPQLPLEASRR
jgi:hypothetical protein